MLALFFSIGTAWAQSEKPLRLGLTAVVASENLRFFDRWAAYLTKKMGRPVEFIRRRSYREVMEMLEAGSIDFAWICGYPFVQRREPEYLQLMAVPIYQENPLYHSYIIVHRDSPYKTLDDLQEKVFAFSDPDSNSGFLYPQFLLANMGFHVERFFRETVFTFNHGETIEAVAERFADGGAVDSYIWEYLAEVKPEMVNKTRVINKSPPFGFPPLVARRGIDKETTARFSEIMISMSEDPEGRAFLKELKLDGFGIFAPELFQNIREIADEVKKARPWLSGNNRK
ncbi:MAG: phosphate/phosphite/phosphonate ABC transporter substrate-binding protein [Rhodospirillales bacterium]|nr:phosphate/phosphite/phosphonate ABC transporter substrate-binding protein [Rhodospirillales bacterium]